MNTGLANDDGFDGDLATIFVSRLLFAEGARDVARFASDTPLEHEPGKH